MRPTNTSRREFLNSSALLASSVLSRAAMPALAVAARNACSATEEGQSFTTLSESDAIELEAIAARILPATSSPGAREAGVVHFFDQAYGTIFSDRFAEAKSGLADFLSELESGNSFAQLSEDEQDAYLETQQETKFFQEIRVMTIYGFFAMSKYGGNKDDIGWKLIGMPPGMRAYSSPFGYYDAEYLQDNRDE